MPRKLTAADFYDLASKTNLRWLDNPKKMKRIKANDNLNWQCLICGIKFNKTYLNVYKNASNESISCPNCNQYTNKTDDDYHKMAKEASIKWIGKRPKSVDDKTEWACKFNHKWKTTYSHIKAGTRCPKCAGLEKKNSKDYKNLARKKGFVWLGEECKNVDAITIWECKKCKNIWETSYNTIRICKGCVFCNGTRKKTPEHLYNDLADEKNIRWVGKKAPKTTKHKTSWRCDDGHQWQATYGDIKSGRNCPRCNASSPERRIELFLIKNNIENIPEKRFNDCRDKNTLPFDFYLPDKNILIEYHGELHYERRKGFWGGNKELNEQQRRDKIKSDWAAANGITLLVIPYTELGRIEEILSSYI